MSIATELTLLANSKQAIKNSINQKGGSITDSTPFADYSTAIDNLPSGGSGNPLLTSIDVSDFSDYQFDAKNYITGATIPNGVTDIASECFSGFGSLTNVVLPNNLLVIGGSAFSGCRSITSLVIPDSVTSFGSGAFLACENLTSINIPSGITTIGNSLFRNCTRLQKLDLPSGITTIGPSAFQNCSSLTYVVVRATTPPTLSDTYSFQNTNNCPIYVPAESVDTYKAASVWSTYASRIYPIQQVATVDRNPVYNYELGNTDSTTILSSEIVKMPTGTSIEFAEGVVEIGGQLGAYEDVTLPSTFTGFIDTQPINAATTTLTSKATTPPTAERDNFGGSGLTAIYVPSESVDTYKAASGWSNFASIIQSIPVPTALKWASADGTQEISIACEDLVTAGTLTKADRTATDTGNLIGTVEGSAEIGDCVTTIGLQAFQGCTSLASVTIPDSVTSIGQQAFQACTSLASVIIPESVTDIGAGAFWRTDSMSFVVVKATTPPVLANTNAFTGTECPFYFPEESIEAYRVDSNWSSYNDEFSIRFNKIEQVATVDGNTVYNYDLGIRTAQYDTDIPIYDEELAKMPTGTSIEFAEGVVDISGQLGAYEDVTLPSTFTGFIDTQPINAATTTLTSKATTPPSVGENDLGGSGLTAIFVPSSAVDTYKAASGWSNFASIIQAIPTE